MKSVIPTVALAACLLFSGCSGKQNWLIGKWEFDEEKTNLHVSSKVDAGTENGEGILKGIVNAVGKGISSLVTAGMKGSMMEFTAEESRFTKSGVGTAEKYEIIEQPDGATIVIKFTNGDIVTWKREGDHIKRLLRESGEDQIWAYFKKSP